MAHLILKSVASPQPNSHAAGRAPGERVTKDNARSLGCSEMFAPTSAGAVNRSALTHDRGMS